MLTPRNTLVVVRLLEKPEQKVGAITVPSFQDEYCEADIIRVGPGNVAAEGGVSETFDLKEGQRVYVKHKKAGHGPMGKQLLLAGIRFLDNDEVFYIFEQSSIIGILSEPAGAIPESLAYKPTHGGRPSPGSAYDLNG
jgi:co-chaperonin GroES (HSP10)